MPEAGDFDTFCAATSRRLVGQLFAMTGDLSEAGDAVQEAFIRAWQRWPLVRAYGARELMSAQLSTVGRRKSCTVQ
jgi:RNA polymerase sigma-70 factor (ECF subfamily)